MCRGKSGVSLYKMNGKLRFNIFFGMIWCEWLAVDVGGGDTRLEKTPSTWQPGMQAKTGNKHVTKT